MPPNNLLVIKTTSMIYANSEQEALAIVINRYKELPDEQRVYARHKAKCTAEWQGATPEVRAFNKKALAAMLTAEYDMKLAQKAEANLVPYTPPTFMEVVVAFRPLVYFIVCAGGVTWMAAVVFQFVVGAAKHALAIGQAYGGWVALGGFAALLVSMLPKIEWTRSGSSQQATHEKYEEETFYQKKSYEKTTTNG